MSYTSGSCGGGGIDYERIAAQSLVEISEALRTLCSLMETLTVDIHRAIEQPCPFLQSGEVHCADIGVEVPVETMDNTSTVGNHIPFICGKKNHNGN